LHRILAALGILVLLLIAGCGLDDYEKRMKVERERLEDYDLQAKYLGDPIDYSQSIKVASKQEAKQMGKKDDGKATEITQTIRAYLRPPKDIASKSSRKEGSVLQAYDPVGTVNMNAPFQGFYLGVGFNQKPADFRNAALKPFGLSASTNLKDATVQPAGRPAKRFGAVQTEAKAPMGIVTLYVYIYEEGPYQVALIYKVLQSKASTEADRAIDYSLRSVEVGDAAIRAKSRR